MVMPDATELREAMMALARQLRRHRPDNGLTMSQLEVLGDVNRTGVTVHGRTGFSRAAPPRTEPATGKSLLPAAFGGLLPAADIGLRLAAAPFVAGPPEEHTVAVVVGIEEATPARPQAMLLRMVSLKRMISWVTTPTWERRSRRANWRRSVPPMRRAPSVGS